MSPSGEEGLGGFLRPGLGGGGLGSGEETDPALPGPHHSQEEGTDRKRDTLKAGINDVSPGVKKVEEAKKREKRLKGEHETEGGGGMDNRVK